MDLFKRRKVNRAQQELAEALRIQAEETKQLRAEMSRQISFSAHSLHEVHRALADILSNQLGRQRRPPADS